MSDPGPCSKKENGHSWYTTKRRIDEDITFCWECGVGWVPDNGLLVDSEIDWPEPVEWLQADGLRWTEAQNLTGLEGVDTTTDADTYAGLDRNQEVTWLSGEDSNLQRRE